MPQYQWPVCRADVRDEVDQLVATLRDTLCDNLVSVYLHGSLAMGCFNPSRSGFENLLADCKANNRAVQTIKSITQAPWGKGEDSDKKSFATWYRPLTDQADIDKAVAWVLGRPGIFLNSVGDIHVLPKVLAAVAKFSAGDDVRPASQVMDALVSERAMSPMFV